MLGASHCTTLSVQTNYQLSTHACEFSGSMVCTLSAMRFCRCGVAWGVTMRYILCAHYPSTEYTCMRSELWTLSVLRFCCCFVDEESQCTTFSVHTIRQLSTHACVVSRRMVCTLIVGHCCNCFVFSGVPGHYIQCEDSLSTQYTCICGEWYDGSHTHCRGLSRLLLLLGVSHCTTFSS